MPNPTAKSVPYFRPRSSLAEIAPQHKCPFGPRILVDRNIRARIRIRDVETQRKVPLEVVVRAEIESASYVAALGLEPRVELVIPVPLPDCRCGGLDPCSDRHLAPRPKAHQILVPARAPADVRLATCRQYGKNCRTLAKIARRAGTEYGIVRIEDLQLLRNVAQPPFLSRRQKLGRRVEGADIAERDSIEVAVRAAAQVVAADESLDFRRVRPAHRGESQVQVVSRNVEVHFMKIPAAQEFTAENHRIRAVQVLGKIHSAPDPRERVGLLHV